MSPDVVEYLGCFVHLHPRYETSSGWEEWLADVDELLRMRKVLYTEWPSFITTPDPAASEYINVFKKRLTWPRQLWSGLDALASDGKMSSMDQLQSFWAALSPSDQDRLVTQCGLFNPDDGIWKANDSDAVKIAEQRLSRLAKFWIVDENARLFVIARKVGLAGAIVSILIQLYYFLSPSVPRSLILLVIFSIGDAFSIWALSKNWRARQQIEELQRRLAGRNVA